jgi:membrane protease YdiL (CAAX protease family)
MPAAREPGVWGQWAAFVRRPTLPDRAEIGLMGGLRRVAPLFGLDLSLMVLLLGVAAAAMALGFEMPEHMLGDLTLTPWLMLAIVAGAPLAEEIVFRGWLSGRPGHIAAVAAVVAGSVFAALAGVGAMSLAGAIAGFVLGPVLLFVFRKRPAMGWFQRGFRFFFWGSALLFAAVHLSNFAVAGPGLLPLVLPQFALALILGYLRVTRGLWSAVLLHILHNSVFMALVLAGSSAG